MRIAVTFAQLRLSIQLQATLALIEFNFDTSQGLMLRDGAMGVLTTRVWLRDEPDGLIPGRSRKPRLEGWAAIKHKP